MAETSPAAKAPTAPKKTAVRNVAPGIRGLFLVTGYRDFAPNEYAESVEISAPEMASAKRTNYFRFGDAAKPDPKAEPAEEIERLENPTASVTGGSTLTGDGAAGGGSAPPAGAAGGGSTDELNKMSDVDLKTTTAALTGKPVESLPDDRDELLKLARGE